MMDLPKVIKGGSHKDTRGELKYNNSFDASAIKRVYTISNSKDIPVRGWQGHKIESRWFSCIKGSFKISLIAIKNWDQPSKEAEQLHFILTDTKLDVLYTPPGYISRLEMLEPDSSLLALSDYTLGEVNDEYRYDLEYFS